MADNEQTWVATAPLAELVAQLMASADVSQRDLAQHAHTTPKTVRDVLQRARPFTPFDTAEALLEPFGERAEDLDCFVAA